MAEPSGEFNADKRSEEKRQLKITIDGYWWRPVKKHGDLVKELIRSSRDDIQPGQRLTNVEAIELQDQMAETVARLIEPWHKGEETSEYKPPEALLYKDDDGGSHPKADWLSKEMDNDVLFALHQRLMPPPETTSPPASSPATTS